MAYYISAFITLLTPIFTSALVVESSFENVSDSVSFENVANFGLEHHVRLAIDRAVLIDRSPRIISEVRDQSFEDDSDDERGVLKDVKDGREILDVAVRYSGGQLAWHHNSVDREQRDKRMAHTLCILDPSDQNITLIISSPSVLNVSFHIQVILELIAIGFNETSNRDVSPTTPFVWKFLPDSPMDRALVEISSNEYCAIAAVQPLRCPFYDDESDVIYRNKWQTLTESAAIDVRMDGLYANGFFITVITKENDTVCHDGSIIRNSSAPRIKTISLVVTAPDHDPVFGTFIVIFGYIVTCLFTIVLAVCCNVPVEGEYVKRVKKSVVFKRKARVNLNMYEVEERRDTIISDQSNGDLKTPSINFIDDAFDSTPIKNNVDQYGLKRSYTPNDDDYENIDNVDEAVPDTLGSVRSPVRSPFGSPRMVAPSMDSIDAEIDEPDSVLSRFKNKYQPVCQQTSTTDLGVRVTVNMSRLELERVKPELCLADMAHTVDDELYPHTIHMKTTLYVWIILLMGVFYALPVFQLVRNYEGQYTRSGNMDLCYFNFRCKLAWVTFEDYGHVFSNVGYVISGLFFIGMTAIRRSRYRRYLVDKDDVKTSGIPEQYGIFFAMGVALLLEGFLSGCYHICPTSENFQFDTTFMYVLAVLIFFKVFQFRHPDVSANAYIVFSFIAGALIFEVIGVYVSNLAFWSAFILCYISITILFIVQTYYNGVFLQFYDVWSVILRKCLTRSVTIHDFSPMRKCKFFFSSLMVGINLVMAGYFGFRQNPGVSRYLLLILILNMALYLLYYVSMKIYRATFKHMPNERISHTCILYALLAMSFMITACYFFILELKNSSRSPATSRTLNAPCAIGFFDNHDLWHFLSAAGLFFTLMMILTLEDGNLDTPWTDISVF